MSQRGYFNQNFLGYDYVVYQKGTTIKAVSSDPSYDDVIDTDFVDLVEACYTNRGSVGANIKFYGNYDIHSTLNFPTTDDLDFCLIGDGMQNSTLTAHADLGANTMMICDRGSWDSPQDSTTVVLKEMKLDPNNIADSCLELPYTLCDLDNIFVDMNLVGSSNIAIGELGGAGGPSYPAQLGKIYFHHISSAENHHLLHLLYDNCTIQHIGASLNANDTNLDVITLEGEYYDIGSLVFFHGAGGSINSVLYGKGMYAHIGLFATVTSGGGSTIDGAIRTDGACYISGGIAKCLAADGHTLYYDAGSQADCDFQKTRT